MFGGTHEHGGRNFIGGGSELIHRCAFVRFIKHGSIIMVQPETFAFYAWPLERAFNSCLLQGIALI